MKRSTLLILGLVIVVAAGLFALGLRMRGDAQIFASISSFEDCKNAGFSVLPTSPESCATPDGRTFARLGNIGRPSQNSSGVSVVNPKPGDIVASPLVVAGEAAESWFSNASEGVFPVTLLDADGTLIAETHAAAEDDSTKSGPVSFMAKLAFSQPKTATGTLVLMKDNPSGLPENAAEVRIQVAFASSTAGVSHMPQSGGSATTSASTSVQQGGNAGNVPVGTCKPTGCSGEICSDQNVTSACIYNSMYACYKESFAKCERQSNGACGWSPNESLQSCLKNGGPAQ